VGGRVHLDAAGRSAERKATWVIKGRNTTVEGIEFSGSHVRDLNGAGIRQEGAGLTVRYCYFHDNEMGILTGRNHESDIVIEYSVFDHNTVDYRKTGRLGHNIYIGNVRSFTLRYSYVHGAIIAHNVKSRADTNKILYNRIMDNRNGGGSSYLLDLPNGGRSYVIGNLFHQNPENDNKSLISYSAEGARNPDHHLYVINNTFVNDDVSGTFVQNRSDQVAVIRNNIFIGPGVVVAGAADVAYNLLARKGGGDVDAMLFAKGPVPAGSKAHDNRLVADAGLVDRDAFDYHLTKSSPAIDAAGPPGIIDGFSLTPTNEYVSPEKTEPRKPVGPLDIGAYEFTGS